MRLKQTRLVTKDVLGLAQFYEAITGVNRSPGGPAYVEFQAPCDGLAIAGEAVQNAYGSDVVATAANRSAILDFEVEDVDREYHRLRGVVTDWVLAPTDQPRGTRGRTVSRSGRKPHQLFRAGSRRCAGDSERYLRSSA